MQHKMKRLESKMRNLQASAKASWAVAILYMLGFTLLVVTCRG